MNFLDKVAFEDFVVVLWNIWNARNNVVFHGKDDEARLTWDRAKALENELRIHNFTYHPFRPRVHNSQPWCRPPSGVLKIKVDAATLDNKAGIGVIVRVEEGFVIGGMVCYIPQRICVEWLKLLLFRRESFGRRITM